MLSRFFIASAVSALVLGGCTELGEKAPTEEFPCEISFGNELVNCFSPYGEMRIRERLEGGAIGGELQLGAYAETRLLGEASHPAGVLLIYRGPVEGEGREIELDLNNVDMEGSYPQSLMVLVFVPESRYPLQWDSAGGLATLEFVPGAVNVTFSLPVNATTETGLEEPSDYFVEGRFRAPLDTRYCLLSPEDCRLAEEQLGIP